MRHQLACMVLRRAVLFACTLIPLMLVVSLLSVDVLHEHRAVNVRHLQNIHDEDNAWLHYQEHGRYGKTTSDISNLTFSAINGYRNNVDSGAIPQIIHQAWDNAQVPNQVNSLLSSWLSVHPRWQHWFWTEDHARRLIGRKYPHYLDLYDQYPYKINRADVRRYFIMYEYGGVYADLDVESLRSLNDLLQKYPCIIAQEPLVHQVLLYANLTSNFAMPALMACRREHPFFKLLIDSLQQSIALAWTLPWNDNILHSTGPHYVARILEQYQAKHNDSSSHDYVHLAPWQWFMPDYDSTNLSAFHAICSNMTSSNTVIEVACKLLEDREDMEDERGRGGRTISSYTRHHWMHTWSSHFTSNVTTHVHHINSNIRIASVT